MPEMDSTHKSASILYYKTFHEVSLEIFWSILKNIFWKSKFFWKIKMFDDFSENVIENVQKNHQHFRSGFFIKIRLQNWSKGCTGSQVCCKPSERFRLGYGPVSRVWKAKNLLDSRYYEDLTRFLRRKSWKIMIFSSDFAHKTYPGGEKVDFHKNV